MSKIRVYIEKKFCTSVIVEITDGLDEDEQFEKAEDMVKNMLEHDEIMFSSFDETQTLISMHNLENNTYTEWESL